LFDKGKLHKTTDRKMEIMNTVKPYKLINNQNYILKKHVLFKRVKKNKVT